MTRKRSEERLASLSPRLKEAQQLLQDALMKVENIRCRESLSHTRKDVAALITKANQIAEVLHATLAELNKR